MSTLREAAQAAPDAEVRAQHKEFARWFLELSDKSALASEYLAWLAWKAALAHPPRDEWRLASEPPEDDRDVVVWIRQSQNHGFMEIDSFLRPEKRWRSRGVTLWRDVTPPTESTIAAKCQRIEGSGEICGLTPPCPDCGSSLIDVAEGA